MEKFSHLNRSNLEYVESLFEKYQTNPDSLGAEWARFFEGVEFAKELEGPAAKGDGSFSLKELSIFNLVEHYRNYGHLKAQLDPLKLMAAKDESFQLKKFGLESSDLEKNFQVGNHLGFPEKKLKDIIDHLEKSYCGTLSAELADCPPEIRDWFRTQLEDPKSFKLSNDQRKKILLQLARTESLEKFLHSRFVGMKRFSIEGGDALIPMLEHLAEEGSNLEVEELVIGMAHRGRLNVLANFMDKALKIILAEFEGASAIDAGYDGDVKYHLGYSKDKVTSNGKVHVSLAFNPSHLEAVNPVVLGMTRAKQRARADMSERKKVVPVLIHGDAAFAGQGVVFETLQLSQLEGYRVGGAIHVIINNQVGFTTDPKDARSVRYSSDAAKAIKAPVLLVNGDDTDACVRAMDLAIKFRQKFKQDVVIDLICYRRYGHNEGDEPAFTQPKMYAAIKKHPTLLTIYKEKLDQDQVQKESESDAIYKERIDNLQTTLEEVRKNPQTATPDAFNGKWEGLRRGSLEDFEQSVKTKTTQKVAEKVLSVLTEKPAKVDLHPKIEKLIEARAKMVSDDQLDWAMGELLAYGSLCLEGTPVRISGQDCKRGTFTHRQAVYFDGDSGKEYTPLATLNPDEGEFVIYNSPLSEMAVVGFEYGNSSSDPTYLTVWEAQFGDFCNGAQIILDQFLSSAEMKWKRHSGLVLLLPHGYEGQGPEHSSARLERFLQMCAQGNMQVGNFTTPANFFHALRRQVKRDFRKPLIVMSPKSLLRHPKVVSPLEDFTNGQFQEVLDDPKLENNDQVETLVLCSGKIFYDLDQAREKSEKDLSHLAILRLEQLYPLPKTQLAPFLSGFPKLKKVIWAQEEPKNMGAYFLMKPFIEELLEDLGKKKVVFDYAGRTERASPAVGSTKVHTKEQNEIIEQALGLKLK